MHLPVLAGGLPVPPGRCAVCPVPGPSPSACSGAGDLAVEACEEVPLGVAAADAGAGGEVPGLEAVEVDLGDGVDAEAAAEDAAAEVVGDELLVRGVEAEARGERHLGRRVRRRQAHLDLLLPGAGLGWAGLAPRGISHASSRCSWGGRTESDRIGGDGVVRVW